MTSRHTIKQNCLRFEVRPQALDAAFAERRLTLVEVKASLSVALPARQG